MSDTEELYWTVDGLRIAGVGRGPRDGTPVLALHGWLDNAASFDVLGPRLDGCRLVALDLSGHGLSDHRSRDATYQIWDDIPQILGVLDALGWQSCVLLGHSRGATISTLIAAAMPKRVRALVTIDGLLPPPQDDGAAVSQLRHFLRDRARHNGSRPRVFASREEFAARRARSAFGGPEHVAQMFADRALEAIATGYRLRTDARLNDASAMKFNPVQCEAVLRSLTMPALCFWASDGLLNRPSAEGLPERAQMLAADMKAVTVEGHHHFHMEEEPAAIIAGHINRFLRSLDHGG